MPAAAPSDPWRLRLLGGFGLQRGEQGLTRLHSRAARLLLARLAMEPRREHAREELAAWLWPEADAPTALARLRQTLSTLKASLERPPAGGDPVAVIHADRRLLRLAPGALDCDALRFEQAVRAGDAAAAAACYGGELLPGDYDEWVLVQRRRLEALAERVGLDASGLPAARPGASTPPPAALPTVSDVQPPADALPRYLTAQVGGEAPLRAVIEAFGRARLLVLRGPGGCGKTRLAVSVARRLLEDGQVDTARFVPWAGCDDPAAAADRLRQALGLAPPRATTPEAAMESVLDSALLALAGRRALLVLDNAEQLPAAALALVPALLQRLPDLRLVVTSRRTLALPGAREHGVEPLALEPAGPALPSPAAQLYIERARDVRPDFQAVAAQVEPIESVARQLGGLPLALELAAARVRTLPPGRLLALLQGGGAERWRALDRRGAAALGDPRHASIEAVLQASRALLSPAAEELLALWACVSAPVGGSLAVQALQQRGRPADSAWAALDELVADSLLAPQGSAEDGECWWTLPEPVRDLVVESLPPARRRSARSAWRAALGRWAIKLAPDWPMVEVDRGLPMLQALLAPPGVPPAEVVELMLSLAPAWQERSPPEDLRRALEGALEALGAPQGADAAAASFPGLGPGPLLQGHALAADLAFAAGDREGARGHAAALGRGLADQRVSAAARSAAELSLARLAWRADADAARARLHLLRAAEASDHEPLAAAQRLRLEATVAYEADRDCAACDACLHQALRLLAGGPHARGHLVRALRYNLAISAIHAGRPDEALPLLQSLAGEAASAGNRRLLADVLNATGSAFDALGRLDEAERATRASLAEAWQRLETEHVLYAVWNLGLLALRQGEPERAARLTGFADRFWRRHFGALARADRADALRARRRCRQRLGRVRGQRCWDEGAALPLAAAVALALDAQAAAPGGR